jgi:hypothetical protein
MKERIDAVVLYEVAPRELDVALALKCLAETRHGLRLEVAQQYEHYPAVVDNFYPNVVMLPYGYHEGSHRRYLLEWPDAIYFNLAWEQFFYPGNRRAKSPQGEFAVRYVVHHAWSESYVDFLKEHGVPEANILLNGHPAYQLYLPPYRDYFQGRAELAARHKLVPTKGWVFFPENYNWAFYGEDSISEFIQRGQAPRQVQEMRDFATGSFAEAMRWCRTLVQTDDVELILRPRPSTMPDHLEGMARQVLKEIPAGLHIIAGDTVREWNLASDVVVSSYSTSLIEAAVAGKPAFILEPLPIPASLHVHWHDLVEHVTSEKKFLEACLGEPTATGGPALRDWAHETMLSRGDPIVRLADFLAEVCAGKLRFQSPSVASISPKEHYYLWPWLSFQIRRWYVRIFRPRQSYSPVDKKDVPSHDETASRLQRWKHILENPR